MKIDQQPSLGELDNFQIKLQKNLESAWAIGLLCFDGSAILKNIQF